MSQLKDLKVDQLKSLIAKIGLDDELTGNEKKADLVSILEENGATYSTYEKFFGEEEEVATPQQEVRQVLIKMDRKNPSFEAFGKKFTREHPFAIVDEEIADKIIETYDGFRLANPSEARSYYS